MFTFTCNHQAPTPTSPMPRDALDMPVTPEGGHIPCLCRTCHYRKNVQLDRLMIERLTGEINDINRQIRGIEMDPRFRGPQFRGHMLQACASLLGAKAPAEDAYRVRTGEMWDR